MKKILVLSGCLLLLTLMFSGCLGKQAIINDSKKGAFESTAHGIRKSAENAFFRQSLEVENLEYMNAVWHVYIDGKNHVFIKKEGKFTKAGAPEMYIYTGNNPDNGVIHVTETGEIKMWLHDGQYCAVISEPETDPIVTTNDLTLCQIEMPLTNFE